MKSVKTEFHMMGGHQVCVELTYVPPSDPPPTGSTWDELFDLPGIKLVIILPTQLRQYYDSIETPPEEAVRASHEGHPPKAMKVFIVRLPTLKESEMLARDIAERIIAGLRVLVEGRALRLARREAAIAAAHAGHEMAPAPKKLSSALCWAGSDEGSGT